MAIFVESLDAKRFLNTLDLDGQFKNRQQAADPTAVALATLLYGKNKAGSTELFYINSAGVVRDLSVGLTSAQGGPFTLNVPIIGNGGQNIISATLTLGSVLFAGAGGILSQDNTNFFYDSTNKVLTLGAGTTQSLHPSITTNYLQAFFNSTGASANFQIGNNATAINTYIAEIDLGTRGVSAADKRGAVIASQLRATSAVNVTADLEFFTSNASVPGERFRIGESGQWGIAGANFGTIGQVFTSGGPSAAPTWSAAGGGGLTQAQALKLVSFRG